MKDAHPAPHVWPIVRNVLLAVGMLTVVVVSMVWLMGVFHPKLGETMPVAVSGRPAGDVPLAAVARIRIPMIESAVGTIHPVHKTSLASKLLATVIAVNIKAGQRVSKGDVLVKLDDADLKARLQQADASVSAARAARDQAKIEYDRVERLFKEGAASQIERDRVETAMKSTQAQLDGAEQAFKEAQTILSYATILSPLDGTVVDKQVDVGDTVQPGQVLMTLYERMQLIARVRESLTNQLKVGQGIEVRVDALGHACEGQISEIVPEAEAASRTFSVKVTGPCPPGIYPGMFGRLIIPLGEDEDVLVIPRLAVRRVGQLDVVEVAEGGWLRRRVVQLGGDVPDPDQVQVLSGLREGEKVAVPAKAQTAPASL